MTRHWRLRASAIVFATLHLSCGGEDVTTPSQQAAQSGASGPGSVKAQNVPPILIVNTTPVADNKTTPPTISGPPPLTVTFGLCKSDDSDAGDSINWQFNFGDSGRKPFNADGSFNPDTDHECRVEHTYREGTWTAWVSVTDKHLEDQSHGVTSLARRSQSFLIKAEKPRESAASCVPGTSTSYESTNVPVAIPDLTTVESTLTVPTVCPITKVTASLHLTHTFDGDIAISLIAPDGTTVLLSNNRGGGGDNFGTGCGARTGFDDAAPALISLGAPPFSGTFRPDGLLSALNGKNPNGVWRLRIADTVGGDSGNLLCWGLRITN